MYSDLPITVIIPTFNAGTVVGKLLDQVRDCVRRVIIVDGGSSDSTCQIASRYGVTVLRVRRGRGYQLQIGGDHATTDWLLFLHADTILEQGWQFEVCEFLNGDNLDVCGAFSFGLDDSSSQARRVERLTNWRSSILGLPYGDQGLLISRAFYFRLGGFRALPLMEDVEFIRRVGKSRLRILNARAVTSSIRYRTDGWYRRPFRNLICLVLYFLGVPPHSIAKIYK